MRNRAVSTVGTFQTFSPPPSPLKLAKLSRQPVALGQQVRQSVRAPRRRVRVVPLDLSFYPGQCSP